MATDIRKTGIRGLNGIRYEELSPEQQVVRQRYVQLQQQHAALKKGSNANVHAPITGLAESVPYEVGTPGFEKGRSRYDRGDVITPVTNFEELQQKRYDEQPWYDVAANGIAKAVGRAATSAFSGIIGGVVGLGTFAANGFSNAADLFDNPLTNALADIDDWANENFVNYKSVIQQQNEQNGEWYKNLSGLNMIMDDIVTNFGFIVGMGLAAGVTGGAFGSAAGGLRNAAAGALRAARRSGNMAKIWGATKAAGIVQNYGRQTAQALTLINSSAGEAALEGLGVKREMMQEETDRINATIDQHIAEDPNIQALDNEYNSQMSSLEQAYLMRPKDAQYQQYKDALTQQYQNQRSQLSEQWEQRRQAALQEIDEASDRAGTATALLNMAILIPSNFNMYGRLINKSFRNAEKSAGHSWAVKGGEIHRRNALNQQNIIGSIQGQSWDAIRGNAKNYGSRSFLGNVAKRTASTAFSEGVYEEMGQSAASIGAKAYHEWDNADNYWKARLDPDSIDRFVDCSHDFLSALGQGLKETYGSVDGWRDGFIGAISGIAWGAGEARDEWRDTRYARRAAKDLNKQLQNDRLPNLLQHIIAQSYHDNVKEGYARMNDQGAWKTEDDKAAYALVSAFDRAGRMDDLQHLISAYAEQISDQDIEDMINSSTRTVTSQEQINQMKQEIRKNTAERVESYLREGASMDDYMRSVDDVNAKEAAVERAETALSDARQRAADDLGDNGWLNKPISELRTMARRARDPQKKAAARAIVSAHDTHQQALEDARYSKYQQRTMYTTPESEARVQEALEEYNRLNEAADNSAPEEYMDGPFVTDNGANVKGKEQVKEELKHNTERINQVVKRYQNAVEKVNRDTRGVLSKDQEDYLAYAQFMAESSGFRAQEMVEKLRGILPEYAVFYHKDKKTAAKFAGVSESEVTDLGNGQFQISTKHMTDRQFANFMLYTLLKQSHVTSNQDTGDGTRTAELRKSLAQEALDAIEREYQRTGRRDQFDREQLQRDFEDIERHFKNEEEYRKAYEDARSNPESILTAKDKALRFLKRKYDQAKTKLRQKQMSIQQLGELNEDELQALDAYHYALAKAEKLRRGIKQYWDSVTPNIYSQLERMFESVQDPEARAELIQRAKDFIDQKISNIMSSQSEEAAETPAEEVSMMIELDDIVKEGDPLWDKLNPETRRKIADAMSKFNDYFKRVVSFFKARLEGLRNYLNNLRSKTKQADDDITPQSSITKITGRVMSILSKAKMSAADSERLNKLKGIIEEKIASLGDKNNTAASALKGILSRINRALDSLINRNEPDTEPVSAGPHTPGSAQPGSPQQNQAAAVDDVAGTPETAHMQNPSQEAEENQMRINAHIDLNISTSGSGMWQTVTGEFARRSNFTYLPYHEIVEEELKKYPDDTPADKEITIDALGPKGNKHTFADWKRFAKRSRIVHERMKDHYGYIDAGNVKHDDNVQIHFLITRTDDGELIVYLVQTKDGVHHLLGDLPHPDYGVKEGREKEELKALYKEFERELGDKKEAMSSHVTHVANVYSGFLKYSQKEDGEIKTRTVASFGEQADDVEFHVHGAIGNGRLDDMMGRASIGQPVLVLKRPGNNGLTRRIGVPVVTHTFGADSIEMKVIQAAVKKFGNNHKAITDFLKHFLNCQNVYAEMMDIEDTDDAGRPITRKMLVVDVKPRAGDPNGNNRIRLLVQDNGNITISGDAQQLRANVSAALLRNPSTYNEIAASDSTLPKTYNDFLKQVCHVALDDLRVHNSWITVNKLTVNPDNTVTEQQARIERQHVEFNDKGNAEIPVSDGRNGAFYLVEVQNMGSEIPTIVSIRGRKNGNSFVPVSLTELNKNKLLPVMAQSIVHRKGKTYEGNKFMYEGMVYTFTLNPNGSINSVKFSEVDTARNVADAADKQLLNAFRVIARHYNGSDASWQSILKKWLSGTMVNNDAELQRAIRSILKDISDGKTKFSISPALKARALNSLNSNAVAVIDKQRRVTSALVNKLKIHGLDIKDRPENIAEAQRIIAEAEQRMRDHGPDAVEKFGDDNGINFFLSGDGKIIYGFARTVKGKSTIWLDPDLLNPETLVHEYTHLWTRLFRKANPDKWNKLVDELEKNHPDVWNAVVNTYSYRVKKGKKIDRNAVADEVFAKLTGEYGREWIMANVSDNNVNNVIESLRKALNTILDWVKDLFGVPHTVATLQELVIKDMLSDNPLTNLGIEEEQQAAEEPAAKPEEPAAGSTTVPISDISGDMSSVMAKAILERDFPEVAVDGTNATIPNNDDLISRLEDAGFDLDDVSFHMDVQIDTPTHPDVVSVESNLGKTAARNIANRYSVDSSFEGLSAHIDSMKQDIDRGYISTDDFLLAAELLLSSQQRADLWKEARNTAESGIDSNWKLAAHIQFMFHKYLQGTKTGNKTIDNIFSGLVSDINKLSSNTNLSSQELIIQGMMSGVTQSTDDPLMSLTREEKDRMYNNVLDSLTERDVEYLEIAGYTPELYRSLQRQSKGRIRKCVL